MNREDLDASELENFVPGIDEYIDKLSGIIRRSSTTISNDKRSVKFNPIIKNSEHIGFKTKVIAYYFHKLKDPSKEPLLKKNYTDALNK